MARGRRKIRAVTEWGRLDPKREVELHWITEGPARGWLHTHGLAKHGKPELEVRNVPGFLRAAGCAVLNDLADYLLNEAMAPLLPGQTVGFGTFAILVAEAHADEAAGYDPGHYDGCTRLTLLDPPSTPWDCDECRRELAERPKRLS